MAEKRRCPNGKAPELMEAVSGSPVSCPTRHERDGPGPGLDLDDERRPRSRKLRLRQVETAEPERTDDAASVGTALRRSVLYETNLLRSGKAHLLSGESVTC